MIEPQLVACVFLVHHFLVAERTRSNAIFLGIVIGLCMAIKVTSLWMFVALVPLDLRKNSITSSAMAGLVSLITMATLFGSIYFFSDQHRFREMWSIHSSDRILPLQGIIHCLKAHDARQLFYLAIIAFFPLVWLFTWYSKRIDRPATRIGLTILAGTFFVVIQGDLPPRYMLPVVVLALLEIARLWNLARLPHPQFGVIGALSAAVAVNLLCFRDTLLHPHNKGGKFIQEVSSLAAALHLPQSVPPSECIHVHQDIPPASAWYLAVKPEHEVFPAFWVQHGASAGPSPGDNFIRDMVVQRGIEPVLKLELYDVYSTDPRLIEALREPISGWQWCR